MPTWRALTTTDMLSGLTSREQEILSTAGGDDDDRLPGIISDVTAEVRGRIATWTANQLDADTTKMPGSFIARAAALARWRLMASIPNYTPSEARKLEYEKAEKFFESVAAGKMRPEAPDDPITNTVPQELPGRGAYYNSPGSRTGRTRMDGL